MASWGRVSYIYRQLKFIRAEFIECWLSNHKSICNGLFQKKSKQGRLRTYLFEKTPGIFRFVTLPLEIPDKMNFDP